MKLIRFMFAVLCCLIALALPLEAVAAVMEEVSEPLEQAAEICLPTPLSIAPLEAQAPFKLDCVSAMLVEPRSGQIIFEQNADERRPVASVTKVMSILLALEAVEQGRVSMDDLVPVSKEAAGMGGSQVLLDVGEKQPLSILLKSMIVGSANDATVAVGEHLYGSEQVFVQKMNERAAELNMADTCFVNSTGLPTEGQYTTARDVARMMAALILHPAYFEYSGVWLDEVDHGDGRVTSLTNTNRLIRLYDGCDGGKTGSTNEAGYCMAATAKRGEMRLLSVVLGAKTGNERFSIASKTLDYGFANYKIFAIAERGARVRGEMKVLSGDRDTTTLILDGSLTLLMSKSGESEISMIPNLPDSVSAPLTAGQRVGSVDILRDGVVIAQIPVAVAEDVNRQGFFSGWGKVLRKWFYH